MNGSATNRPSETDWARVESLTDETIDTSDIPPLPESLLSRASLRPPRAVVETTVHLDPDLLAWFKAQGGPWEQRLNAALRVYVEAHLAYQRSSDSAA